MTKPFSMALKQKMVQRLTQLLSNRLHATPQRDCPADFLAFHRTQMAVAVTHCNTSVANGKVLHLILETTWFQ
jgi:hypothetical protein